MMDGTLRGQGKYFTTSFFYFRELMYGPPAMGSAGCQGRSTFPREAQHRCQQGLWDPGAGLEAELTLLDARLENADETAHRNGSVCSLQSLDPSSSGSVR